MNDARQLRENIFGPMTDEEWDKYAENWIQPFELEWLRKNQSETDYETSHQSESH